MSWSTAPPLPLPTSKGFNKLTLELDPNPQSAHFESNPSCLAHLRRTFTASQ